MFGVEPHGADFYCYMVGGGTITILLIRCELIPWFVSRFGGERGFSILCLGSLNLRRVLGIPCVVDFFCHSIELVSDPLVTSRRKAFDGL